MFVWRRQLAAVAGRVLAARRRERSAACCPSASPTWCPTPGCRSGWRSASWPRWWTRSSRAAADVIAGARRPAGQDRRRRGAVRRRPPRAGGADRAASSPRRWPRTRSCPTCGSASRPAPVLTRMGDVFGTTVNLASRLTALAAPGTVLVDRDTADALERQRGVRPRRRAHPGACAASGWSGPGWSAGRRTSG